MNFEKYWYKKMTLSYKYKIELKTSMEDSVAKQQPTRLFSMYACIILTLVTWLTKSRWSTDLQV